MLSVTELRNLLLYVESEEGLKMRPVFSVFCQIILCLSTALCADADAPAIGTRPIAPADVARLATRLKDPDAAKACSAAHELGDSRQAAAAPPLMALYRDGDGERRLAALKALAALSSWNGAKKPDAFLGIALGDILFTIRRFAALELARVEGADAALKRFSDAANDAKKYSIVERNRAIHHAVAVGGFRSAQFLRDQLISPENEIAIAAAEELGEIRDVGCVDALLKALSSDREDVRFAARTALERQSGKPFKFDLVKWTEWRAALRDDYGAEKESSEARTLSKNLEYAPELWPAEIVIAFDTTGSFLHIWPQVNQALDAVLRELKRGEPGLRVGLIRYRAIDARATLRYTLQPSALTANVDAIEKELSVASFGGGSGALHAALRYALNGMVWRERSRKVIVIIGDDSPVSDVEDPMKIATQLTRDAGLLDGIQVNTLYAKTTAGEENRQTYRRIAAAGIGRFYEFNKAEQHLVEMSAPEVNVKGNELPAETARKWFRPRDK